MTDKQKKKRVLKEKAILIADEQTQAKVGAALDEILSKVGEQKQNAAQVIIKHNISKIDALSKAGLSLSAIYRKLNAQIPLGISPSSFTQYVRAARQQTGSSLYKTREQSKSKNKAIQEIKSEAAPSVRADKSQAPSAVAAEAETAQKWNCDKCAIEAKPYGAVWICPACKMSYRDDGGKISSVRIKK